MDFSTIWLPLHRWALDKQSCHCGLTDIVECRPPLGALPLSPTLPQAVNAAKRRGAAVGEGDVQVLGWHNLSNADTASFVFYGMTCLIIRLTDMLHDSPLLKKTCVGQVVSDEWFPPKVHAREEARELGDDADAGDAGEVRDEEAQAALHLHMIMTIRRRRRRRRRNTINNNNNNDINMYNKNNNNNQNNNNNNNNTNTNEINKNI